MTAYKTGERQEVGKIAFEFYSGTLWMVLPSGRRLAYLKPKQQPNRFGRMSLTYEGVGQNHKWSRQETYSGRLVENATQAIARDILAEAMDRISAEGLNIVAHVHDKVIITGKVQDVVQLTAQSYGINAEEQEGILKYLIEGGDLSLYGLSNAVTRTSQDVVSYDRATTLEGIGWQVATMEPVQWKQINQ